MSRLSTLLLADADKKSAGVLAFGFERTGATVTQVHQADDLVQQVVSGNVELVVLSIQAGGLSMDVVRAMRDLSGPAGKLPILVLGAAGYRGAARAAGANDFLAQPAYVRDVVTLGQVLATRKDPTRELLNGDLADHEGIFHLMRALSAAERTGVLTVLRGIRRGELRFYQGEVTSAQVGSLHGIAALHQLLLWSEGRFELRPENVVRRQQIPLAPAELFEDAGRFLRDFGEVAGDMAPGLVYEQDLRRVAECVERIPKEVGPVLRLFDGSRSLADVIEDSPFRVFETVKIAARLAELGAVRVSASPKGRSGALVALAVDDWRVGSQPPSSGVPSVLMRGRESEPVGPRPGEPASPPPPAAAATEAETALASDRKKKKKKQRKEREAVEAATAGTGATVPAVDWGKLPSTPGPYDRPGFAQVVPSQAVTGEIMSRPAPDAALASAAVAVARDLTQAADTAIRTDRAAVGSSETLVVSDATPVDPMPAAFEGVLAGSRDRLEQVLDTVAKVNTVADGPLEAPATNGASLHVVTAPPEAQTDKVPKLADEPKPDAPSDATERVDKVAPEDLVAPDPMAAAFESAVVPPIAAAEPVPEPVPVPVPVPVVALPVVAVPEPVAAVPVQLPPPPPLGPAPPPAMLAARPASVPPVAQAQLNREVERATQQVTQAAEHAAGFDDIDEEFFSQEDRFAAAAPPAAESFDDLNEGTAPPKGFWKRLFSSPGAAPAKTNSKTASPQAARPARPPSTPQAAATTTTPQPQSQSQSQPRKPNGSAGGGNSKKKRR